MSEIKRYRKALAEIRILAADMFENRSKQIEAIADAALEGPADERLATLTARQREIYDFIKSEILEQHRPPTFREIGLKFGIASPNGVKCHLNSLRKKRLVGQRDDSSRGLVLLEAS